MDRGGQDRGMGGGWEGKGGEAIINSALYKANVGLVWGRDGAKIATIS